MIGERQRRVLDFLLAYSEREGFAPTVLEIADGCDVHSTSTVAHHLTALERRGLIWRPITGGSRAIDVRPALQRAATEERPALQRGRSPC